jgi:hypothetical protein
VIFSSSLRFAGALPSAFFPDKVAKEHTDRPPYVGPVRVIAPWLDSDVSGRQRAGGSSDSAASGLLFQSGHVMKTCLRLGSGPSGALLTPLPTSRRRPCPTRSRIRRRSASRRSLPISRCATRSGRTRALAGASPWRCTAQISTYVGPQLSKKVDTAHLPSKEGGGSEHQHERRQAHRGQFDGSFAGQTPATGRLAEPPLPRGCAARPLPAVRRDAVAVGGGMSWGRSFRRRILPDSRTSTAVCPCR